MSYDYFVSDIESANVTAPNQNYAVAHSVSDLPWSVAKSI